MTFDREHRLFLLFLSGENPLWDKIFGKHNKGDFTAAIAKPTSLHKWRNGKKIGKNTPDQIFSKTLMNIEVHVKDEELRSSLEEQVKKFHAGYRDRKLKLYDAADLLGMPKNIAQFIMDEAICKRLSLFPSLLYDTTEQRRIDEADAHFKKYRGVCHMYIRRAVMDANARRATLWLRAAMTVRYVVEVAQGLGVRCKLNFPVVNTPKNREILTEQFEAKDDWFEYDGFIGVRKDHIFWFFEKRVNPLSDDPRDDCFNFITSPGHIGHDKKLTLHGSYLTVSQEDFRSILADEIVMQRIALDESGTIEESGRTLEVMRTARVLKPNESRLPERLLKEAKEHKTHR